MMTIFVRSDTQNLHKRVTKFVIKEGDLGCDPPVKRSLLYLYKNINKY